MKTKHLLYLSALLIFCLAMFGCKKENEEKPGSIYGVVTDFSTGEPVGSANVQLRPGGETTLTGTDGMYEFTEVAVGSYSITVSKAEYTDLIDDYVIEVNEGKRVRRDVQIEKRPLALHLYDNESHEISELDFGADEGVTKKTFNIFNKGTQKIEYAIEKSVEWISDISQPTGTINTGATKPIVVTIDRRKLAVGDNITTLLITSNEGGGKELTVKAKNIVAAPTVGISEAIAIDSTTYRIKCEVVSDGGQDVTERGICWNTYGDPTMDDETIPYSSGGTGQYTIRMEHLSLSTRYYVRAYAKNSIGTGLSEVIDFMTGALVTMPSVSTVELSEITATSAVCLGNVTSDGGDELTERGVCWSKNANPTIASHHLAYSTATTGVFNVAITGLTPNTTYHVRAYAKNSKGTAYGDDLTFITTEGLPVVTTSGITEITATSAKGGGEVTDQGASTVTERGICWDTSHNPTTSGSHANSGIGAGSYMVSMTNLTPNATYYVRAYATNAQGTAYGAEVSFTALEGLPVVQTLDVSDITSTTAKGHGKVTDQGGSTVSERGICWSTSPSPSISGSHTGSGTGTGEYTVSLSNLTPGTKYYVRAYATNAQGTTYGEQKDFTTAATLPTVVTGDINGTTAHGEVTNAGGAIVTERGICWSTSHNPTTAGAHGSSGTGVGAFSVELTDLAPGTTYYVRAYATNSAGTAYGSEKSMTTSAVLPTVTTGEVSNITQTTAQGSGNVTNDGGATVTERGVCWSTSHNPTISGNHANSGTGTGGFTVNMTGLTQNTTYFVRAYATNSQGTSYGNQVSFKTSQSVSSPTVTTGQVTDITQTSAKCSGNVTADGGATVTECGICWSTSHNPTTSGSHANSGMGTGTFTVNMTGLTPNTTYYVRAYAINSAGTSYGSEVSFTTLQAVTIPTVTTSEVTNIQQTTATGGGNVTSNGGSSVTERGICWSTSHNPTTIGNHASSGTGNGTFSVNMTGLTANTTYYVRAYATNSAGTAYGSEVNFTTSQIPSYTITVSANPSNGGTVSGGGSYQQEQSCTVTATAATGYTFLRWTENGSQVSTNASYTFTVSGNRTLVAEFQAQGYTISVSANPTNGGTVSGGGTYNYGQSCTVTATANTGYTFLRWTENGNQVSTNTNYTFTVNGNRSLVANFIVVPQAPTGAINGLFSVSATQQVWFSQGNLQYIGSSSVPYWKFAEHQWDYLGTTTGQNNTTSNVDRDLFGWGTSGWYNGNTYYMPFDVEDAYPANYQYGPSGEHDLTGEYANADWGVYNPISNGGNIAGQWRTLTNSEWGYMLFTRTTPSGIRFAKAIVNDVNGVIVLPDDWVGSTYALSSINNREANYNSNVISASNWTNVLQTHGAVFLPAGGSRAGTSVLYAGTNGYYWSTSYYNSYQAKAVFFSNTQLKTGEPDSRYYGRSVRLVQDY